MGEAAGLGGGVKNLQFVPIHCLLSFSPLAGETYSFSRGAVLGLGGEETFGFERRHAA
jgi:hypothetical protein